MKVLIVTQKIDADDDLLGFFYGWVEKIAKKFQKVNVICLQGARHYLPENVQVWSLGKETGKSKIKYIYNFYRYIWKMRNEYDAVLVHMNKEYVILGGPFWLLWGKKIFFWYNHRAGGLMAKMAGWFAHTIFFTSPFSYFAKSSKAKLMPVGIDTKIFIRHPEVEKITKSILYLGRISPIKNLDLLIKSLGLLRKKTNDFSLFVVGASGENDQNYLASIKQQIVDLKIDKQVFFLGNVPNNKTAAVYNRYQIFVNLTNSGSLDKTIFEAMSCETPVLVSNRYFVNSLPPECFFKENDAGDLMNKLSYFLNRPHAELAKTGIKLRDYVIKNHDLDKLVEKFWQAISMEFGKKI